MIRRPPRSTLDRSSAASDVYKRQVLRILFEIRKIIIDVTASVEDFPALQVGIPQENVAVAGDPVSYTHLRAHETVLDLVCRLLLENKKTTARDRTCQMR